MRQRGREFFHMTERKVKRGKQGFTLSEMLVAVAILVVLLSLA